MINRVMFAALAHAIAGNLMDAANRHIAMIPNQPVVVVIVYLQRHARPLRKFLEATFNPQFVQAEFGLDAGCIKVLLLDSARGMTADYVHVIRGSRKPDCEDQYWGIQSDTKREYISYTRARQVCHVWLERKPFGAPNEDLPAVDMSNSMSKGYRHAASRNGLINDQQLPWNAVFGNTGDWSWWKSLPKDTPQTLVRCNREGP
jgi:hypothetical protein